MNNLAKQIPHANTRMYRVDAYFLSKQLADLPMFLFIPVFFISILYHMVKLNPDTARFLVLLVGGIALSLTMTGLGKKFGTSICYVQYVVL